MRVSKEEMSWSRVILLVALLFVATLAYVASGCNMIEQGYAGLKADIHSASEPSER